MRPNHAVAGARRRNDALMDSTVRERLRAVTASSRWKLISPLDEFGQCRVGLLQLRFDGFRACSAST